MKNKYAILLLTLIAACVATGCRQKVVTDDMDDREKLEVLDRQIEKHPDDAALLAQRAQVLLNLGRQKEASYDINKAVKIVPDNERYLMLQADICFVNGDVGSSYTALSQAEKIAPESKEVQLKMGELTFYNRDYDRSLKHLTNVTDKEPDNRTALFMKGFIYKEKGDTASAVTLLRKVCDLYADYEPAFEELGILYATHHDPMAVEYLATALRLEPGNTNAMYALAMYYQETGEVEKAEELYHRMIDINENSADAWHNLGYIEMFHYRDYGRAIDYMTKATEADGSHLAAWANLGCAYELNEQPAEARRAFETALELDASYRPALDGLERLK